MTVVTSLMILMAGCGQNTQVSKEIEVVENQEVSAVEEPTADQMTGTDKSAMEEVSTDDQTVAEERITGGELSCLLPAGFVALEGEEGLFVSTEYPEDIACIGYVIASHDGELSDLTESALKESIEQDLQSGYGAEVEVRVRACENLQIDNHAAIKTELSYCLMGTDYEQIQVIVVDEESQEEHIFSYIQEKGGKWMDKFRQSIETISFK